MARAIILMFDSFGVGASADAHLFGDVGANTLGHIAQACAEGQADNAERQGPLNLPNLTRLGLAQLGAEAAGHAIPGLDDSIEPKAQFGFAQELSNGKDTPSGHWELAGVPVQFDWHYFPKNEEVAKGESVFPPELISAIQEAGNLPGVLGECHASGTAIIAELGEEHIRSGKPIIYTSADSVLQIAAHEEHFGLERLITLCEQARAILDQQNLNVGRVIARPFTGESAESFKRTSNRRDFSVLPPAPTVLVKNQQAGNEVISIGKIADIYAHQGITQKHKAAGNNALFDVTLDVVKTAPHGSIIFPNFVDFDMEYGHRRNVAGYAHALEQLDQRLPELEAILQEDDIVFITADHGCDPTWPGSDHTREYVPVICFGKKVKPGNIGKRETFADIGQTIAEHLGLPQLEFGTSFLN
ncbi:MULTISPECIES: phosphopentomutase [Gammaproteobacteria]|uniref:phosphopentomutase n=1 Tax=Gammaproteobacteria TaxID=1236 RepID=UPI000DCFA153|nr:MULTISPECIES: phosphopentomutase [Gammaproteobacteria]RTE86554.1 phosphopentomutase [Aliidiomarina sp. B3213]TCZ90891.1 phosphopentomutase [Lysobacter sp. N42]